MREVLIICRKELRSFFDSLIAYILLVLFLGFSGFFTWMYGSDIFLVGQTTLRGFFSVAYWSLFFFIPALTMRLLAEEKKTGTIELLLTKAVSDRQVVLGKFLGTLALVSIALLFTAPYVITLANIGNLDQGEILCGYFALLLMSGAYTSIGLFTSSITNNQIVAFLTAIFIGLFFHLIFEVLASNFSGWLGALFSMLSLSSHYDSISRGVLDSRDLIYFASIMIVGLLLAELSLTKRNVA
ncbi:MAG: ABC transporter permease subunit [Bacteroidetes bacterium]|nr:ABC transporter permease subunit [Bacteroidota bacterium]